MARLRLRRILPRLSPTSRYNFAAGGIAALAAIVFLVSFQPQPAGAHLGARALQQAPLISRPEAATAGAVKTEQPAGAAAAGTEAASAAAPLTGRLAMMIKLAMLERGRAKLEAVSDYTATFMKQEKLDGQELQEPHTIHLKLRHEPFSIYMRWLTGAIGQEVLYVDGMHDNRMLVKKGGGMSRLLPSLKLDPHGSLAMAEARHPVTEAGLLTLTKMLVGFCTRDMETAEGVSYHMLPAQRVHDRPCSRFVTEYATPKIDPVYRKSVMYIDDELSLPVYIKNYCWPNSDQKATEALHEEPSDDTLIEFYAFSDIQLDKRLADEEFDHRNKEYTFKR